MWNWDYVDEDISGSILCWLSSFSGALVSGISSRANGKQLFHVQPMRSRRRIANNISTQHAAAG
jgi:hypothetical protein